MRLSFVGITPDTLDSQCPAVFVDEDTGEIWFQGDSHRPVKAGGSRQAQPDRRE